MFNVAYSNSTEARNNVLNVSGQRYVSLFFITYTSFGKILASKKILGRKKNREIFEINFHELRKFFPPECKLLRIKREYSREYIYLLTKRFMTK